MADIENGILHRIEDDISETWVEDLAAEGISQIEEYLAKHLAFIAFIENSDKSAEVEPQI